MGGGAGTGGEASYPCFEHLLGETGSCRSSKRKNDLAEIRYSRPELQEVLHRLVSRNLSLFFSGIGGIILTFRTPCGETPERLSLEGLGVILSGEGDLFRWLKSIALGPKYKACNCADLYWFQQLPIRPSILLKSSLLISRCWVCLPQTIIPRPVQKTKFSTNQGGHGTSELGATNPQLRIPPVQARQRHAHGCGDGASARRDGRQPRRFDRGLLAARKRAGWG